MLRLAKNFKLSKNLTSQLLQLPKQVPKNESIKFRGRIWSQQLVELMVRDTVSTRAQLNGIEDKSSKNYYLLYKKYESMKKELTMIEKDDHNGIEKWIEGNGVYWSESVRKGKISEYVSLLNEDEPEEAKDQFYNESTIRVNFEDGTKFYLKNDGSIYCKLATKLFTSLPNASVSIDDDSKQMVTDLLPRNKKLEIMKKELILMKLSRETKKSEAGFQKSKFNEKLKHEIDTGAIREYTTGSKSEFLKWNDEFEKERYGADKEYRLSLILYVWFVWLFYENLREVVYKDKVAIPFVQKSVEHDLVNCKADAMTECKKIIAYPSITSMIAKRMYEYGVIKTPSEVAYKNVYLPFTETDSGYNIYGHDVYPGLILSFWKAKSKEELGEFLLGHKDKIPILKVPIEVNEKINKTEMAKLYVGEPHALVLIVCVLVLIRYRYSKTIENIRLQQLANRIKMKSKP